MLRKVLFVTAALALYAAIGVQTASAAIVIRFNDPDFQDGTLSSAGGGAGVVGAGIDFQSVQGLDTPLNAGATLDCVACVLNFTTGAFVANGEYAGGGSFVITGSIFDGAVLIASGVLLSGTFDEAEVDSIAGSGLFIGGGADSKNADLLAYFGLAPGSSFSFANTEISAGMPIPTDGSAFNVTVTNADTDNLFVPVPEPGALVLLGLGLVGVGRRLRRSRC